MLPCRADQHLLPRRVELRQHSLACECDTPPAVLQVEKQRVRSRTVILVRMGNLANLRGRSSWAADDDEFALVQSGPVSNNFLTAFNVRALPPAVHSLPDDTQDTADDGCTAAHSIPLPASQKEAVSSLTQLRVYSGRIPAYISVRLAGSAWNNMQRALGMQSRAIEPMTRVAC